MWVQDPSLPLHLHEDFQPTKIRKRKKERKKKKPCYLYHCKYEPISLILITGYYDASIRCCAILSNGRLKRGNV